MKEVFENLKEKWKDPKGHSIVVLLLWIIFIVIVVVLLNMRTHEEEKGPSPEPISPLEVFANMESYEFSYHDSNNVYDGVRYKDNYLLYLSNKKFFKNDLLYDLSTLLPIEEPSILKIDNKFIYELIKNLNAVDNGEYNSYFVPLISFMNSYENINYNDYTLNNYNVVINVYEKNNQINKITLDLTNYFLVKNTGIQSYILTIDYFNINKINDFTSEYKEMIGVSK